MGIADTEEWGFFAGSNRPCRILGRDRLWDRDLVLVWDPSTGSMEWMDANRIAPLPGGGGAPNAFDLTWRLAGARILDSLSRSDLVAPLHGLVTPLPHQIETVARAMRGNRVRFLLADEVGLGKTIEAGLIVKELKIRGLVRRTLVVTPAGLTHQWVQEMRTHFEEDFRLVQPSDFSAIRRVTGLGVEENIWRMYDQVVVSADSVKPLDGRRGWSNEQLARYNRERFDDLVRADWDMIIVDEAHRLGGSTSEVARYRLGEALAGASPYLLLLSGTPHQGKTEPFRRLLGFLDPDVFPDGAAVTQSRVAPHVIRTEKRNAVDSHGHALFRKREVRLQSVTWSSEQKEQKALYDAVTEYVREGYNQAVKEKRTAVGFLMVLMQRLVTSSTRAIRWALERRLEHLVLPEGQLTLFAEDIAWDWDVATSDEALNEMLTLRLRGLKNERKEVELLLSAARRCEAGGVDAKARLLLDTVRRVEQEENDPEAKVLVFTEFVATQEMLRGFLEDRGYSVATLNGSMPPEQRQQALAAFADDARILVSTEAGGEGLNLQFCHLVINFDLNWNPMRLEQRIGRVDRIGQQKDVKVFNLTLADTVESRVQDVLTDKLQVILKEFGVDKLGDVLDSEQGDVDFDHLYVEAIRDPLRMEQLTNEFLRELREKVSSAKSGLEIFGDSLVPDPRSAAIIEEQGLPALTEIMTVAYLRSQEIEGGEARRELDGWHLVWPDGFAIQPASFIRDMDEGTKSRYLSLEHTRIKEILDQMRPVSEGHLVPEVVVNDLPGGIEGDWSLWRVELCGGTRHEARVFPVFLTDNGQSFSTTARALWDRLLHGSAGGSWAVAGVLDPATSAEVHSKSRHQAKVSGETLFREMSDADRDARAQAVQQMEETYRLRLAATDQIGLDAVRMSRRRALEKERDRLLSEQTDAAPPVPTLSPLLVVRLGNVLASKAGVTA